MAKPEVAEPKTGEAEGAEAPAAAPRAKPWLPVAIALVAAGAGAASGLLVVGPKLAAPAAAADTSAAHETAEPKGHGAAAAAGGPVVKLENLVVNPAGSEGRRFLMTSVAFEVENEAARAKLEEAEPRVRDAVGAILEQLTIEQLTMPGARDTLKVRLSAMVQTIIGVPVTTYLPQMVLQ